MPTARRSSPTTTGTIGLGWPGRNNATLARRRSVRRRPSSPRTRPTAARAAAASTGEGAVVKMSDRARLTMRSTIGRGAATKPPTEPRAFDIVPTTTVRPGRGVSGPSTACASSRTSSAPWCAQSSASSATGATSPSIENTASLATRHRCPACSARRCARSSRSTWRYTSTRARLRRAPSMMEAWFNSSLNTTVRSRPAAATSAPIAPRFAANPLGNVTAASAPFHAASAASSRS